MRVLLVSTAREVGGAEIYIKRLVLGLKNQCEFTVVLSDNQAMQVLAHTLSNDSKIVTLPVDKLSALPGVMRDLQQRATDHDLIHLNSNHPASRLGIALAFGLSRTGKPIVSVEHRATPVDDVRVPAVLAPLLPMLFRWSRKRLARVIAVSKENARCLQEVYGLAESQIAVVNNGVDVTFINDVDVEARTIRSELGLDEGAAIVLVLSRLSPNKGHKFLIAAAPAILERHPNTHFIFAGQDDMRAPLDAQIAALNLKSHFHFVGVRSDVPALLRQCDVFVLPSLAEGFSLALIEAMASGAIVVATCVGGAEEVIEDGRNGFLVPAANADSLASKINLVVQMNLEMRMALSHAASASAGKFSVSAMCSEMNHIYKLAVEYAH